MIFFIVDIIVASGSESQKPETKTGSETLRVLYKWPGGEERSSNDSDVHFLFLGILDENDSFPW